MPFSFLDLHKISLLETDPDTDCSAELSECLQEFAISYTNN